MRGAQAEEAGNAVQTPGANGGRGLLFDIQGIDLNQRLLDKEGVQAWIPHRGAMLLLDSIVWVNEEQTCAVGHRTVRPDEFWVPGHFPTRAMFPGVLMVETGAQLALYLFNIRTGCSQLPAFLRIEECSFRNYVEIGDDFYVLCREIKMGKRRFVTAIQGLVGNRIAFEARIAGMSIGEWRS